MKIRSTILCALMPIIVTGSVVAEQKQEDQNASGHCQVVITSFDKNRKLQAVKAVKEATGSSLGDAKTLVESAPATVKKGLTETDAQTLAKKLEAAGLITKVTKE